jgi:MFS family permease
MNSPARVIGFVNAAHFIDHYSMLIFAAAVIVMGPALGMAYSELLPYATPGFFAFGAGSLLTGWLGDRWSRRHMMVIFFIGIGASMIAVGFVRTRSNSARRCCRSVCLPRSITPSAPR